MKKLENPHAFPSTYIPNEGHYEPGISLRDYFAAKAMQGLIAKHGNPRGTEGLLTSDSYNIADAMLTEREKNKEPKHTPDLLRACRSFINDFEGDYVLNGEIVDNPSEILVTNYYEIKKALRQ